MKTPTTLRVEDSDVLTIEHLLEAKHMLSEMKCSGSKIMVVTVLAPMGDKAYAIEYKGAEHILVHPRVFNYILAEVDMRCPDVRGLLGDLVRHGMRVVHDEKLAMEVLAYAYSRHVPKYLATDWLADKISRKK